MAKFEIVNLSGFVNNKLIYDGLEDQQDRISDTNSATNRIFNSLYLPNSLEIKNIHGIPFIFPEITPSKNDNISCEEQSVEVSIGMYSAIHFLGVCEFGNFKEKVNMIFSDAGCEEIEICLYDWGRGEYIYEYDIQHKNCKSAIIGQCNNGLRYIYHYFSPIINNDKMLTSITLPYIPNIHIFSITLELYDKDIESDK